MANEHWLADAVGPETLARLARELPGTTLQSLLLEVMRQRAAARSPSALLEQYRRDRFCVPAQIDQRTSVAIDSHLLAAAASFDAIELSPVTPLGACTAVAVTTQNRVLSALRSTEVVADPTNVLALECAERLREDPRSDVHLATSHRVVRAQSVPRQPGYAQHFRMFALGSGGIERAHHEFTVATVTLHIRTMLAALERLTGHGYAFGQPQVNVLTTEARQGVGDRIADMLGDDVRRQPLDHAYYSGGLRFQIWAAPDQGDPVPLIDGGVFDWLERITGNRRAVYVATGAGAELIGLRFRSP